MYVWRAQGTLKEGEGHGGRRTGLRRKGIRQEKQTKMRMDLGGDGRREGKRERALF